MRKNTKLKCWPWRRNKRKLKKKKKNKKEIENSSKRRQKMLRIHQRFRLSLLLWNSLEIGWFPINLTSF
jgi:hypothetical protein